MRLTRGSMSIVSKEHGAVSLFVVIFATLLVTVVTVSFLRLMVHDQQQATANDLSQSAFDSAQAGVEDAKRALLRLQTACVESETDCASIKSDALSEWDECNASLEGIVAVSDDEVKVQQTSGDSSLDQAYTCVKIDLQTDDFLGALNPNESTIVPIVGTADVATIEVNWYSRDDLTVGSEDKYDVDLVTPVSPLPLNDQDNWPDNRPSVFRVQLMQIGSNGFKLTDFDDIAGTESNANTVFLYPIGTTGVEKTSDPDTISFTGKDLRKSAVTGQPVGVSCSGNIDGGGYACRERITLPTPIGGGTRTAYLRVMPLYNSTHFSIVMRNSSDEIVPFDSVQPSIDSTGRANDYFRRIETRVELTDNTYPYPDYAVEVSGDFCKDFAVTDDLDDYQANTDCQP